MTINTLEIPRHLLVDDDAITTEVSRPALQARLARIEAHQRAALARDQVFAVAMLCLALLFALGLRGV